MTKAMTWLFTAMTLAAATAAAATPEGHYGGTVIIGGKDGGRITFRIDKTSVVGVLVCRPGPAEMSVPLQGVTEDGKITLTAPKKTPGVTKLQIVGETKDGVFKGTVDGVLRGKIIKGEFTAALASH